MATLTGNMAAKSAAAIASCQAGEVRVVWGEYALSAALALNDRIDLVKLPAQHVPVDCTLIVDDLDTDASPAITLDVGITDDPDGATEDVDAFIDGATVGQAGGVARADQKAGFRIAPVNRDRTVGVTVASAPATGATSGKIQLLLAYRTQQSHQELS